MNQELKQQNHLQKSILRVDRGTLHSGDSHDHVHFKDDHALRRNGTWKHGGKTLLGYEKEWLLKHCWTLPTQ